MIEDLSIVRAHPTARPQSVPSPDWRYVHSILVLDRGASEFETQRDEEPEYPFQSRPLPWEGTLANPVSGAEAHERITCCVIPCADSPMLNQFHWQPVLTGRIERDIAEDLEEARCEDEIAPTADATTTCLWIARLIDPLLSEVPNLKSAAFAQDDGGISLIVHSLATRRRAEYCISPEGKEILTVKIDENMRLESDQLYKNQPDALKELAKWVIRFC